jgi:formylglycine-generating enzyme required for sulfatase activity
MKIFTIIFIFLILFEITLSYPKAVIYMNNGSPKSYLINEIENISFNKGQSPYLVKIYHQKFNQDVYKNLNIDSINFNQEKSSLIISLKNDTPKSFPLNEIDSLIFSSIPKPILTGIFPELVLVGSQVSIYGSNLENNQGDSFINFGNTKITTVDSWSETKILVKVPQSTSTCNVSVTINNQRSNELNLSIIVPPSITSIVPNSFAVGDTITLNGKNFGAVQADGLVGFTGGNTYKYKSWNDTKIVCIVPVVAKSGSLNVTVAGVKSNEVKYTLTGSLQTVLIPNGTFKMGNQGTYSGMIFIPESPIHDVTISSSFYMSKFEVTQELYIAVMGVNPSNIKNPDRPVERLSWYDAVSFCNKLSDKDGLTKCYKINGSNIVCDWAANGWRLPTEAEWEYACKAGSTSDFYNGNNESDLAQIAWYSGNSGDSTHNPGLKKPNKFGLYDILGNVFEWVWDWRGNYSGPDTDPTGPSNGTVKIIRGGSWHSGVNTGMCRSSFRGWEDDPNGHSSTDGVRPVRLQ